MSKNKKRIKLEYRKIEYRVIEILHNLKISNKEIDNIKDYVVEKVFIILSNKNKKNRKIDEIIETTKLVLYKYYLEENKDKNKGKDENIRKIIKITDRENANVGNGPSAKLLQIAELTSKEYMLKHETKQKVLKAIKDNLIYPHDYSWGSIGTTTCCFIPLRDLLKNGFYTGHGYIRTPKRIRTAAALSCIIFQSNQNDQHGGQAYGWFDRDMSPYVKKEFQWQLKKIKQLLKKLDIKNTKDNKELEKIAWEYTEKETYQAMESIIFNLNSMHARAGAQVPFTSINIGTDISKEGRLITKCLLQAYSRGLGNGEQPLFPNIIFKVKKGINALPNDINFDLFKLSIQVTVKRLFPNYVFLDSTLNKDYPEDVPVMGCRTRIAWDINSKKQSCESRGNLSFTTSNLVGLALKAKYKTRFNNNINNKYKKLKYSYNINIPNELKNNNIIKTYFVLLNENIEIIIEQLLDRFKYQCSFKKEDFPFLFSGVWRDSKELDKKTVKEILSHGTLSIGFIGLAETLKCLIDKHHGENEVADKLGEEIIKFMKSKVDLAIKKYHLNFSLLGTPAEGLAGKLINKDKEIYGIIEGVTDKEWYTNSFHVPVEYNISIFNKIKIEGKYHKYCTGGQISYIELQSSPKDNPESIYTILMNMLQNDMSYVAINFPLTLCKDCGFNGEITDSCPVCKSKKISRIGRITGYLAELEQFNKAKKEEYYNRKKHSLN